MKNVVIDYLTEQLCDNKQINEMTCFTNGSDVDFAAALV